MSKDVRNKGTVLIDVENVGVDTYSDTVCMQDYNHVAFQINVTQNEGSTSAPTGNAVIQTSINFEDWVNVEDASFDITTFSSKIVEYPNACSLYYRVKLDLSSAPVSASGSITGSVGVLNFTAVDSGEAGNSIEVVLEEQAAVAATGSITGSVGVLGIAADTAGVAGNSIEVVLVDGATADSETVTVVGSVITVDIESGVSTVAQVITAIEADVDAAALIDVTESTSGVVEADSVTLSGGIDEVVAGSETISVDGSVITIKIESGVSVSQDILDLIEADAEANALVTVTKTDGAMESDSVTLSGGDSFGADFKVWASFKKV